MKLFVIISLMFSLVVVSVQCSTTPTGTTGRLTLSETVKYVPLEVGNEWYYTVRDGNSNNEEHLSVIGTKHVGLYEYYVVEATNSNLRLRDTLYYRMTLDGKLLKYSYGIEHTVLDFVNADNDEDHTSIDHSASAAVPAGIFNNCLSVTTGANSSEKYAEGVGLVERTLGTTTEKLVKAKVHGVWCPS